MSDLLGAAYTPEWKRLVESFEGRLDGCTGETARGGDAFFAHNLVTSAIQRLRAGVSRGARLNETGLRFVTEGAAYLARIAAVHWARRGLKVSAELSAAPPVGSLVVSAERERGGTTESYAHDFIADAHRLLLRVPERFPYRHGRAFTLASMALPSPEYLYLYGATLLASPHAAGNWAAGDAGEAEARELWIDDLHLDAGLPGDAAALRELSARLVFPAYGETDHVGEVLGGLERAGAPSREQAADYFRRLLRSQAYFIRNFAARGLMALGQAPRDPHETACYRQALDAHDAPAAGPDQRRLAAEGPMEEWRSEPALSDPAYLGAAELERSGRRQEALEALERVLAKNPSNWFAMTAYAGLLGQLGALDKAEPLLKEMVATTPDCPTAHLIYGAILGRAGRRIEALKLFKDAVRRWPWNHQAVDACLWLISAGLLEAPEPGDA